MTAIPAAILGPPARIPCRSPRALALRVVPLWPDFEPTATDTHKARRLRAALADAYRHGGRLGLDVALREELRAVLRNRAETADEARVLRVWYRCAVVDLVPAWLATAYAEGWPHPGAY